MGILMVSRGEKMLYSGTDPESYFTEYTLVYEEKIQVAGGAAAHSTDCRDHLRTGVG